MSAPAMLGVAAAGLALALPVLGASTAIEAAHRANGAADAAALAAADAALGWVVADDPCEIANIVVLAADARLEHCEVDRSTGAVRVQVSVPTLFGTQYARAHAGPFVA